MELRRRLFSGLVLAGLVLGCSDSTDAGTTFPVTAKVLGPSGQPQGGATLTLQNPPSTDAKFTTITDAAGSGTIQSPAGAQVLIAKIGTVFTATLNVNVQANSQGTNAGSVTLAQSTSLGKVLVIYAGCEQLEDVLRDPKVAFTVFDTTDVGSMRTRAATDSTALLNYLKGYSLVFSDCNCGDETSYPVLARVYGRYVTQGGKIYGGHYNYMNLQYIFTPSYQTYVSGASDSIKIVDANLSTALGASVLAWTTSTGYDKYSDLPANGASTVYAVFKGTTPSATSSQGVALIVENRQGTGKYLWTIYHNQDIKSDTTLIKIVRYFLYTL